MGMELTSKLGEGFYMNCIRWSYTLALAESYGWEPLGTIPSRSLEGLAESYLRNAEQIVAAEDASNLADALEASLEDIPDAGYRGPTPRTPSGEWTFDRMPTLKEYFAGAQCVIRDFIAFCRLGSFMIC